jgi:hypothetical protein
MVSSLEFDVFQTCVTGLWNPTPIDQAMRECGFASPRNAIAAPDPAVEAPDQQQVSCGSRRRCR